MFEHLNYDLMKHVRVFTLSIFLLQSAGLGAQNWFDSHPQWVNYFSFGFAGAGYEYVSVAGDTLLQGKTAQVLKRFHDMNAVPDFTDFRIARQSGDTVWCWNEAEGQFFIHYNFSLGVGDSVTVPLFWNSTSHVKYLIQSKGTIFVDGQSLRSQTVIFSTGVPSLKCSALIIEKIGMISGQCLDSDNNLVYPDGHHFFLDEPNTGATDGPDWSFCRYENDQFEYKSISSNCDALTDVNTPGESAPVFSLSPNPFNDQFTIRAAAGESMAALRIFDARGGLIRHIDTPASNTVSTADLSPGLYFVEIVSQKQQRSVLRAVKE